MKSALERLSGNRQRHAGLIKDAHVSTDVRVGHTNKYHIELWYFNPMRPVQNGCHFADDFSNPFVERSICYIEVSLNFVPRGLIDNNQVLAWRKYRTMHYLMQCWSSSMTPYGVIMTQWVKATQCTMSSTAISSFFLFSCNIPVS